MPRTLPHPNTWPALPPGDEKQKLRSEATLSVDDIPPSRQPTPPLAATQATADAPDEPVSGDARASEALRAPILPERYADRGLLGLGGMGEVRRVYDRVLDRTVAMKLIREDRASVSKDRDHFAAEARATGRLAHPAIIPVYDHGITEEGRLWFTMPEVRGQAFSELFYRLHDAANPAAGITEPPSGFRRLVDMVERASRAVAYAHARGVVHRDIKPSNLLAGDHGEVVVVDWGLLRTAGLKRGIAGTPVYMAPEQARGDEVDARSDVYGLAMVLWELCAGHHPFLGMEMRQVLQTLGRDEVPGPPPSPWIIPDELLELILCASDPDPDLRPIDGAAFANRLRAWLDGETRRERAREHIRAAQQAGESIRSLRQQEEQLRREAEKLLAASQPWEPDHTREAAWEVEDQANGLSRRIAVADREIESELEAALIHDPGAMEAHLLLARRLRSQQAAAEQQGQSDRAAALELRLRRHLGELPREHPERLQTEAWLRGDGMVSLHTEPPNATVELAPFATVRRRLEAQGGRLLGGAPLLQQPLAQGSWLLRLRAPGRPAVDYPVFIGRQTHWEGRPPEAAQSQAIYLPKEGELGPEDCYVPAGWAELGGDPEAPACLPHRRVWVDGFVMRRFPVTNKDYLVFLNDLVGRGEGALAERYAPRNRGVSADTWGEIFYGRAGDGSFFLQTDADGQTWHPDWPVIMVDHVAAWAYARWLAARSGKPWRLPVELEWEKAARGVDRRFYPWGDFADATWCNNRRAWPAAGKMEPVGSRPSDRSLYGVQDMAGNVV
ncbi:MAG TPA: bifunctional serine/threonine-protein kinase/formylglycine-generating enzyme family protein, partial [Myxococcota bacterium]|nr:bifunctional serine/threonine-protein kinase/formylglycine-generating enzyme family protein [Myxococcota bacterium]